jgi:hypothetical protein
MNLFGAGGLASAMANVSNKARRAAERQAYQGARRAAKVSGSQRSIGSPATHAASARKRQTF